MNEEVESILSEKVGTFTIGASTVHLISQVVQLLSNFTSTVPVLSMAFTYVLSTLKDYCRALSTLKRTLPTLKFRDNPVTN